MKPDEAHIWTDAELEKLERRIAAEYKKAADELTDTINDYFEKFKERDEKQRALIGTIVNGKEYTKQDYDQWRLAQIGRGKRFEALRDRCAERVQTAREVAQAYIDDATPGIYSLNRNYAAYTIEQVAGDVGFDLWDERTVRRLIVEEPALMPAYSELVAAKYDFDVGKWRSGITKTVTSSILQGKSIPKISRDLRDRVGITDRASAIRAARTSVTGAQNAGRIDSYYAAQDMGIELRKTWISTLDNRTRHTHKILDGKTADVDEPFEVDGYSIMYPGDPNAVPEMLYNCRCSMIAAVKGVDMSDAKRRTRDPETGRNVVISNMTFREWEKWKKK